MILGFADKEASLLAQGQRSRKLPPDIQVKALKLLRIMQVAREWNELRHPPGNRLHALHGNRAGRYAIRINDQWRIAFTPRDGACDNVEIIDYH